MTNLTALGVIVPCGHCGQKNRVPYSRLADAGTCGNCKNELKLPTNALEVPDPNVFDALKSSSALPVVVDFWAPWCGPCRMVAPEMEKVAAAKTGAWLVVKINTEALPALGARYNVQSIPTMAVFRDGHEMARTSGARPAAEIQSFVQKALQ